MNKHFLEGFEKRAGIIQMGVDALKGLITGKKYLYHGTSKTRVPSILKEGLKPAQKTFREEMNKNLPGYDDLVFLTPDKNIAKQYANMMSSADDIKKARTAYKDLFKKVVRIAGPIIPSKIKPRAVLEAKQHLRNVHKGMRDSEFINPEKGILFADHPDRHILKIEIPKKDFLSIKSDKNPYWDNIIPEFNGQSKLHVALSKHLEVPIKGTLDKKYIKG